MAFIVVQSKTGTQLTSSAAGATVATAWTGSTAAGNLLLASLVFRGNATTSATAGWSKAVTIPNGVSHQTEIWYKANSSAADPAPTFTIANSVLYAVHMAEVSGVSTTTPLDKTGTATISTVTTVTTAVSAAITASSEFVYAACGLSNNSTKAAISFTASSAGGGATFGADIGNLTAAASGEGLEHTWATSGASGTLPSITQNFGTVAGSACVASFKASGAAVTALPFKQTNLNQTVRRASYY